MEFEDVADELFAARREDFTALRDERVKQARPDRELARRIGELRKPTVAAWLVNQVSRGFPEEIEALAALGTALRRAHEQLQGQELRRLSRERHETVERLGKRAQWLARKEAYPLSDATSRQVADTFEAAVSDEQALAAVRAARLSAALTPGSPEQWLTAAVLPASEPRAAAPKTPREPAKPEQAPKAGRAAKAERAPKTEQAPKAERPAKTERAAKARRDAEEAKARREEKARQEAEAKARQEADEAAQAQAEAEQSLADAEQAADEAAETVSDLETRLAAAKKTERERRAEVTAARRELTAAKRKATAAEKRATSRT